jgi:hypothetical protein
LSESALLADASSGEVGMTRKTAESGVMGIYLGRVRLTRVDAVAARLGISRSRLVGEALDALLARFEREGDERPTLGK